MNVERWACHHILTLWWQLTPMYSNTPLLLNIPILLHIHLQSQQQRLVNSHASLLCLQLHQLHQGVDHDLQLPLLSKAASVTPTSSMTPRLSNSYANLKPDTPTSSAASGLSPSEQVKGLPQREQRRRTTGQRAMVTPRSKIE